MKINHLPSLEYLNECFELSENSPSGLIWKVRPQNHFPTMRGCSVANSQNAGKFSGSILTDQRRGKQYFSVKIANFNYLVHRIVYSMFHNIVLSVDIEIDHTDNNGLNNLPNNIRVATGNENKYNVPLRKDNKSGVKGVSWYKRNLTWRAQVRLNGKIYHLGYFQSKEAAEITVQEFRSTHHDKFANHG